MKLLFSYTGPIIKDENGNYYSRTITDKMLSRYFSIANEVTILTRVKRIKDQKELDKLTKINVEKLFIRECPSIKSFKKIYLNVKVAKGEIKAAVEEADIIIVRLPSLIGNYVVSTARKTKKKYLLEVVGCPKDVYWNHSFKGKIAAIPSSLMMKKKVKEAPYVQYVTKFFLQERYPTKGVSIGCSDVSLPVTDELVLEKRIKKIKMKGEVQPIIIGTIGTLDVKYKGQKKVIQAISKLSKEGYNFEYHVVGGGDPNYLKTIAKKYKVLDKVNIIGALPHEMIFKYLDAIDIYVQPSKTEGLPRALVEAMNRGCPAIASNAGGIPELIKSEFIFNPNSINEICSLIKKMSKSKMLEAAHWNFKKAKEYDTKLLNERRLSFYEQFAKTDIKKTS